MKRRWGRDLRAGNLSEASGAQSLQVAGVSKAILQSVYSKQLSEQYLFQGIFTAVMVDTHARLEHFGY